MVEASLLEGSEQERKNAVQPTPLIEPLLPAPLINGVAFARDITSLIVLAPSYLMNIDFSPPPLPASVSP